MKTMLKIEEAAMLAVAVYLNTFLPYPGWLFWVLFLVPDLGFIGYAFNTRTGAITYNLLHHKAVALVLYLAGLYYSNTVPQFIGLLLFAHSSFDRMLGYGLKYSDNFKHTHLGVIGQK